MVDPVSNLAVNDISRQLHRSEHATTGTFTDNGINARGAARAESSNSAAHAPELRASELHSPARNSDTQQRLSPTAFVSRGGYYPITSTAVAFDISEILSEAGLDFPWEVSHGRGACTRRNARI